MLGGLLEIEAYNGIITPAMLFSGSFLDLPMMSEESSRFTD